MGRLVFALFAFGVILLLVHSFAFSVEFVEIHSASSQVSQSADDAEEFLRNGRVYLESTDLELVEDGPDNQLVGLRFQGVDVPKGAIIRSAFVEFTVDEPSEGGASIRIQGEKNPFPEDFSEKTRGLSLRPKTLGYVEWFPEAWGSEGGKQRTFDLSPVVQEIIGHYSWESGNPVVMFFSGSGIRVAESFDGEKDASPKLFVEYTIG